MMLFMVTMPSLVYPFFVNTTFFIDPMFMPVKGFPMDLAPVYFSKMMILNGPALYGITAYLIGGSHVLPVCPNQGPVSESNSEYSGMARHPFLMAVIPSC